LPPRDRGYPNRHSPSNPAPRPRGSLQIRRLQNHFIFAYPTPPLTANVSENPVAVVLAPIMVYWLACQRIKSPSSRSLRVSSKKRARTSAPTYTIRSAVPVKRYTKVLPPSIAASTRSSRCSWTNTPPGLRNWRPPSSPGGSRAGWNAPPRRRAERRERGTRGKCRGEQPSARIEIAARVNRRNQRIGRCFPEAAGVASTNGPPASNSTVAAKASLHQTTKAPKMGRYPRRPPRPPMKGDELGRSRKRA
jgi:hypothetical protein